MISINTNEPPKKKNKKDNKIAFVNSDVNNDVDKKSKKDNKNTSVNFEREEDKKVNELNTETPKTKSKRKGTIINFKLLSQDLDDE